MSDEEPTFKCNRCGSVDFEAVPPPQPTDHVHYNIESTELEVGERETIMGEDAWIDVKCAACGSTDIKNRELLLVDLNTGECVYV